MECEGGLAVHLTGQRHPHLISLQAASGEDLDGFGNLLLRWRSERFQLVGHANLMPLFFS